MGLWPDRDRAAWLEASRRGGPLDEPGRAAGFSPETVRPLLALYGAYLTWLDRLGELDWSAGPETRFTFARMGRFIQARRATVSDNTLFNNLGMLSMLMKRLVPERDWNWIRKHPAAPTLADARAARRPQPVFDPGLLMHRLLSRLEKLRHEEMSEAVALDIRNLVMLGVAVHTGMRRQNLVDLRLGHSLLRRASHWEVFYDESETKADEPIATWIPASLEPYLKYYMDVCRPFLLGAGPDTDRVWISRREAPLTVNGLRVVFSRLGQLLLNEHLHPHEVRHTMATTLLRYRPNGIDIAAAALTHKGTATVIRHYDHSGVSVAQGMWADVTAKYRSPANRQDTGRSDGNA